MEFTKKITMGESLQEQILIAQQKTLRIDKFLLFDSFPNLKYELNGDSKIIKRFNNHDSTLTSNDLRNIDIIIKSPVLKGLLFVGLMDFTDNTKMSALQDDFRAVIKNNYEAVTKLIKSLDWNLFWTKWKASPGFASNVLYFATEDMAMRYFAAISLFLNLPKALNKISQTFNTESRLAYKRLQTENIINVEDFNKIYINYFAERYCPDLTHKEVEEKLCEGATPDASKLQKSYCAKFLNNYTTASNIWDMDNDGIDPVTFWLAQRDLENKRYYLNQQMFSDFVIFANVLNRFYSTKLTSLDVYIDTILEKTEVVYIELENTKEKEQKNTIKKLKKKIVYLETLRDKKQREINVLTYERNTLNDLLEVDESQISSLDETLNSSEKGFESKSHSMNLEQLAIDTDTILSELNQLNIVFIGGHQSWVQSLQKKIYNAKFFGPEPTASETIDYTHTDLIVFKTNYITHAQVLKFKNSAQKHNVPYVYSNQETNVERTIKTIYEQFLYHKK